MKIHSDANAFACSICDKRLSKIHLKIHEDSCREKLINPAKNQSNEPKKYSCNQCDKVYTDKNTLKISFVSFS